jgi:hypothetical protein
MFVRYYVELPHDLGALETALLSAPNDVIPSIARRADEQGQHLLAEVGFAIEGHRVSKRVEIEVGPAVQSKTKTWLPISWHATGTRGLFPVLEGDLELAPLSLHRTQLSLSARYQPPLGLAGRTVDRALLSRVAEATIKDFVDRVAQAIEARVPTPRIA